MSETELYNVLIVEATRLGHRLFRNSVGRARYRSAKTGDVFTVPYGVGGVGGSDLIGWTVIRYEYWLHDENDNPTPKTIITSCKFTAIEVKRPGKKPTAEQLKFLEAVRAAGGLAGVVTSLADYHELIGHRE